MRHWLVEDRGEFPEQVIPRIRPLRQRPGQYRPPAMRLPVHRLSAIRLSDAELEYKKHVERGHFPYRSDCRECLRGAGMRSKPGPHSRFFQLGCRSGRAVRCRIVRALAFEVHAEAEVSVCCLLLFSDKLKRLRSFCGRVVSRRRLPGFKMKRTPKMRNRIAQLVR